MHIKCPKCKNTNFCISQDTIDGVELIHINSFKVYTHGL